MRRCLNCGDANVTLCLPCSICQIGFYLLFFISVILHAFTTTKLSKTTRNYNTDLMIPGAFTCNRFSSYQASLLKTSTIIINTRRRQLKSALFPPTRRCHFVSPLQGLSTFKLSQARIASLRDSDSLFSHYTSHHH